MPWKECHVMDERLRFVARLLEGETMAALCRGVRDLPQDRLQDLPAVPADAACAGSLIAAGGRIGTPISSRWPSRRRSCG